METNLRSNPVWNEEKTQHLIFLRKEGVSFSEIANRIGVTKNTVIGAMWRARRRGDTEEDAPPIVELPAEIRLGHCRFPLWRHNEKPTHHYCGEPTPSLETAWCAKHRRIVYVPAKV